MTLPLECRGPAGTQPASVGSEGFCEPGFTVAMATLRDRKGRITRVLHVAIIPEKKRVFSGTEGLAFGQRTERRSRRWELLEEIKGRVKI
jgi:hypothetical protein